MDSEEKEPLIEMGEISEKTGLCSSSPASAAPASISPASLPVAAKEGESEESEVPDSAANTDAEIFEDFVNYFKALTTKPGKVMKILYKVLKNIADHPEEDKFKKLRLSNKAIADNILKVQESLEILYMTGFTQETIDGDKFLHYSPASD